jgi:hypothetical protein
VGTAVSAAGARRHAALILLKAAANAIAVFRKRVATDARITFYAVRVI